MRSKSYGAKLQHFNRNSPGEFVWSGEQGRENVYLCMLVPRAVTNMEMMSRVLFVCTLPLLASGRCWHGKVLGCFVDDGGQRVLSGFMQLGEDNTLMDQVTRGG